MLKELRRLFIVGIFAAAPMALTLYLIVELARWFDSLFQPIVQRFVIFNLGHPVPGLGIVLGVLFILLIGLIAPSLIGKQVFAAAEKIVDRLPLAKLIYSGTKQIFDSFSQTGMKKFNRAVLIRFPHQSSMTMGFVTQEFQNGTLPGSKQGESWVSVFVPTTPNPTSGYLLFVPEAEVVSLALSSEEALKFVISCGLVRNPFLP